MVPHIDRNGSTGGGVPAEGTPAPDFVLTATDGSAVHLANLKGSHVILYFYPKDDTPGCTTEACSFRDAWSTIQGKGVVVLGVSRDDTKSHQKFAEKYHLPFTLLSDEGGVVAQKYGVWIEKSMYGKSYMTMARTTFYIQPDGVIGHVWEHVKPEGHAEEVLSFIDSRLKSE